MGGGNLQKSQMARERKAKHAAAEGQGGGGAAGMAKRSADAGVFAAAAAEREKLKATLLPGSAVAKRREGEQVERDLAEAKRKGRVLSGVPASGDGGGSAASDRGNQAGAAYTRSAQFFGQMQQQQPPGGKWGKRARRDSAGASSEGSLDKSVRYKL